MINLAHAQEAASTAVNTTAGIPDIFQSFLPIILIVGVFYFLLIRPQQKQQKKLKQMISNAKKGDEVVMSSGIYGKISDIKDDTIMLQVANNVALKFQRNSIQSVKGHSLQK